MTGIFESLHHLSGCMVPLSFLCLRESSIPHLFQDRGTSNVPARISSRIPRLFLNSKYKFHRFLFFSNRCRWKLTWRWSGLWISQVQWSVLANHSGFSEESAMTKIRDNVPLEFNQFSIDSQQSEFFHLTFLSCNCFFVNPHLLHT